jgi:hypothetical protein
MIIGKVVRGMISLLLYFTLIVEPTYAEAATNCMDKRLIQTLLAPKIEEQITLFYKDKLTENPTFASFLHGNELNIKYNDSHITVKVTVIPYVGPHISVGKDVIHFQINNTGDVKVIEFKHIKNYELPPNWESIIISSLQKVSNQTNGKR